MRDLPLMTNREAIEKIQIASAFNDDNSRLCKAFEIAIAALKEQDNHWRKLSDEKPPVGVPLMLTCMEEYPVRKRVLKYPCYYIKDRYSQDWKFVFETIDNQLLPNMTEVIAWKFIPEMYLAE